MVPLTALRLPRACSSGAIRGLTPAGSSFERVFRTSRLCSGRRTLSERGLPGGMVLVVLFQPRVLDLNAAEASTLRGSELDERDGEVRERDAAEDRLIDIERGLELRRSERAVGVDVQFPGSPQGVQSRRQRPEEIQWNLRGVH